MVQRHAWSVCRRAAANGDSYVLTSQSYHGEWPSVRKVRLSQTSLELAGRYTFALTPSVLHLRSYTFGLISEKARFPPPCIPLFPFCCALVGYYNQQHLLKHRLSYARTTAHSVAHDFDQLDLLFHGATGTIARSRLRRLRAVVLAG